MITVERVIPWETLEESVRAVPLLKAKDSEAPSIYPYEDAVISLKRIAFDSVSPTTLYVIRRNLAFQSALTADIYFDGFDPLELNGGLIIRSNEGSETGLLPPIVEETEDEGVYILDGAHRTSAGRWRGLDHFIGIHIIGIRPDCPAYAFPNNWRDVEIKEEVPTDPAQKKLYRDGNYQALYRDFSQLNGSQLREA